MDLESESKWVICRICLKGEGKMMKIFENNDNSLVLKIENCGGIKLDITADLPDCICTKCLTLLKAAEKFRTTCQRSQATLMKQFGLIVKEKEHYNLSTELNAASTEHLELSSTEKNVERQEEYVNPATKHIAPPPDFPIEFLKLKTPKSEYSETSQENTEEAEMTDADLVVQEDPYTIEYTEDHELLNEPHEDLTGTSDVPFVTLPDDLKQVNQMDTDMANFEFVFQLDNDNTSANFKIIPQQTIKTIQPNTIKTLQSKKTYVKQKNSEKIKSVKVYENRDGNYECPQCDNVYEKKNKLLQHLKLHSQDKPHQCEICNKRFAQTPQLARHMNTHTGLRPFECPFCSACFADPSTRIKHIRTHTNERPYKCEVCTKSFAYSNVLKVHLMTHTGEKPYSCRVCGKQFSQAHHKKNHERTHIDHD